MLAGALLIGSSLALGADSVVVFNEVMYHPETNEPALEWLELHNQMAVDVDLSGWTIGGGIQAEFAEGTIIPGGGYVVVAAAPAELASHTGLTNLLGPFTGRLSNNGDTLELRNNNNRVMDRLVYGVDGKWPVGPDGSGVSLAKRDPNSASAEARRWTVSAVAGGTPGRLNFPPNAFELIHSTPIEIHSAWKYQTATNALEDAWVQTDFDDRGWTSGEALLEAGDVSSPFGDLQPIPTVFSTGVGVEGTVLAPGTADPHYVLTSSAEPLPVLMPVAATVIQNHPAWAANDSVSSWIGVVNPGTLNVAAGSYNFRTSFTLAGYDPATARLTMSVGADNRLVDVLLNGLSTGIGYVGFSTLSGDVTLNNGFRSGTNVLEFQTVNDGDGPNPAGFRVRLSGLARAQFETRTRLTNQSRTVGLRSPFVVSGQPEFTALQLSTVVADGAVFYLNGVEVLRLNLPPGEIGRSTPALSNVFKPTWLGPFLLPNTPLVTGTNVLAVELHSSASGSDLLFGAELAVVKTNVLAPPPMTLVLNEYGSISASNFWVELMNYGSAPVDLGGCRLANRGAAGTAEYLWPRGSLASGAQIKLDAAALGFSPSPGDRLFLYRPGRSSLLDAVVVNSQPQGRWPDGVGPWRFSAAATPGAPNRVALPEDIVINEVMYHPPTTPVTSNAVAAAETWLELYNRGRQPVDLSGWNVEGDVDFRFATGTSLAVDGYLVVANDVLALRERAPGATVMGPFEHALSRRSGQLRLIDAAGNVADEVNYLDRKPWPELPDGGGSSLELRNPWADNSKPESWMASDETGSSSWTNYGYRGVASNVLGPTQWKEFVLGLLDAGECLLDDLRVVENPSTAPVPMLQNGDFEKGFSGWRALGDHSRTRVELDPENPANHVLHLVATGPTDHLHNHLETTLANGRSVASGREYEIAFRAKWLAGNPRLNTRLYFNRVARTTVLVRPSSPGTPGARNSVFAPNSGPNFSHLAHLPTLPQPLEAVTVSVDVADSDGLQSVALVWTTNRTTWSRAPMSALSPADEPGYTNYRIILPGLPAGALVQFYIEATDLKGAVATFPAQGANSRALFKVDDGKAASPQLHCLRLLMWPADAVALHAPTNVMSNDLLGLTVVYDEQEVFYDAGVHLQGSERGRNDSSRVGFTIRFPADHRFRGVQDVISIDRSGGYSGMGGKHDEILLWQAVNHAGGLLGLNCDLVQCFAPRAFEDGTGLLRMAAFDSAYFDAQFDQGGDGNTYTLELIYYPTTTVNRGAESPKLPQPDEVINVDIQNRGPDPELYRWIFLQENHADQDDYSQVVALNQAFSLSGTALDEASNRLMDVDQWLRTLAFKAFTGDVDTFTYGLNHNWKIYFRPEDGRALGMLWDMDFAFVQSVDYAPVGSGSANMARIVRLPNNYRRFLSHLLDLSTTTVNSAYLQRWAAHYGRLLSQNWSPLVDYLRRRSQYLRGTLPLNVPFAITNNAGRDFTISTNVVTLSGTAPLTAAELQVNGVPAPVVWTSPTTWSLRLPLSGYSNRVVVTTLDHHGSLLSNVTDTITVINQSAIPGRPVLINEWMADNGGPGGLTNPRDGSFSDWFELYNPNPAPVDLTGYFLTDTLSPPALNRIPAHTVIGGNDHLLVWADDTEEGQPVLAVGDLHVGFQLSKSGDSIGLYAPDGTPQHSVTFGDQQPNISQGWFPDGDTNQVRSFPDWTPGAPNRMGPPQSPVLSNLRIRLDGTVELSVRINPSRRYRIEYQDALPGNSWSLLDQPARTEGEWLLITDPSSGRPQRFYRVVLIE